MITSAVKRSISHKFILAVLATTFIALFVSGAAMLFIEVRNYQTTWVDDLTSQSNILAKVSLPALEFNDPKVAKENLDQLQARPRIYAAAIYAPDGSLFATYSRDQSKPFVFPKAPAGSGNSIDGSNISLFTAMERNGEKAGMVFLGAEYPLADQVKQYLLVLFAVMAAGLFVAYLVSKWLQSGIIRPVLALTDVANQVIRNRDFSMRVNKSTEDEVGILVDAFNSMLTEVGEREKALETSNKALQIEMNERVNAQEALVELNETLEERIRERTAELERAHSQLRQSQKLEAVGQLTGGVAHDFNNVLQVISGNLQLLQMSMAGNPEAQRRLESAAFAADRGAKLSSQLLAFARRQPLKPIAINVGKILRGMDDLLRRALGESVQIETVVAGGLWTTLVDPHQLENVILNLAINARDAMQGEGKLTLELANAMLDDSYAALESEVVPGQYVMLAISDTGSGMPAEIIARAFEPFFTTKPEGEGTGLGLSMAYGFVKQSSGHIKIYSEIGSGTTIKIYLPRSMQAEVEMRKSTAGPIEGGKETILVVEDDLVVQDTVVDILSGLGYRVLKANDGQGALNVLQSGIPVDLLFTDVVMPGPVRSPDLARQAKRIFPEIDVLFTSGYTQNAIVHGGRLDPGVELISKPYRREDLARKIRHMLSRKTVASLAMLVSAEKSTGTASEKPSDSFRILIVEDNEDARTMLRELLNLLRHRVEDVGSAEEALVVLSSSHFDVLITDMSLPGMSGLDLAKQIVKEGRNIKIVFSTGYGAVSTDELSFTAASLPKPYDLNALKKVLNEVA
jgi:signal transduction histidine kinase/DNA-binding response OmpR family regulator